ncbi:hypothetical protein BDU57DRAFT_308819 [Ampelomyces quisqualis]|uniref:Uncharacterized protein n=1 Tax=Ampelomyces quisqualis TaxID=50730 RepID=A0A6A5QHW9_AMPQU|nr:hypothetical protein BDU57DRAFT_308819 [Ampelomyces quisqualis]
MKVVEKGTDRFAEVHVYVEGNVKSLGEYGEYIDAKDKAICCYVPVVEGHKVKIRGKFTGTTLRIAYDLVIDGVYRKAVSYGAKSVHWHRNKKLEAETFLYKIPQGIIDTQMIVAPLSGAIPSQGEATETDGTIELRVYITRQLGVDYALNDIETYHNISKDHENGSDRSASFKLVPPTFNMVFEKNSAPLEKHKSNKEFRKMVSKRPGTEPWAVFRFHYRSQEAITAQALKMTYDPTSKTQLEPHTLDLEPVPSLFVGAKPDGDDEDDSTRTSPVAPSDVPTTPIKSASKGTSEKTAACSKKDQSQLAFAPKPTFTAAMATEKERTLHPDPAPIQSAQEADKDLLAQVFSKPVPKPSTATMTPSAFDKPAASSHANGTVSPSAVAKITGATKGDISARDTAHKGDEETGSGSKTHDKSVEKHTTKPIDKVRLSADDTIVVDTSKSKPTATVSNGATKTSSLPQTGAKPTGGTVTKTAPLIEKLSIASVATSAPTTAIPPAHTLVKGSTKKKHQAVVPSTKKPSTTPITTAPITQEKLATPVPSMMPTKRTGEPTNGTNPNIKRAKITPTLPTPTPAPTTTSTFRIHPGTPSPRPFSIERKVAEQRKKLEAIRQKRLETAKKQEELDKKMEPYKKRMAEELERLEREMRDEEAAAAEDEDHLMASEEMLKEFEMEDGAN